MKIQPTTNNGKNISFTGFWGGGANYFSYNVPFGGFFRPNQPVIPVSEKYRKSSKIDVIA